VEHHRVSGRHLESCVAEGLVHGQLAGHHLPAPALLHDVVDLSFVKSLAGLREFGLSATRGRKLRVHSLEPLGSLTQIELLWLVSLQVQEGGLKPLYSLRNLASLRTNIKASSVELRELRAAVPTLKYFQPVG
jgi:hypothetical protein